MENIARDFWGKIERMVLSNRFSLLPALFGVAAQAP